MKKKKVCPECRGHGGTYTTDNMGQPMGIACETCRARYDIGLRGSPDDEVCANGHTYKTTIPNDCPDCRILRGLDDVPSDYQIIANAAEASKRRKK